MNDVHDLDSLDPRRHYTPNQLARASGIPARTIRSARDLPRLRVDCWNRICASDFIAWLESRKAGPTVPPRENVILARVADALRRDQMPSKSA